MGRTYRYKDIQLAQLRSFCLAARERNFTAAARTLGLSASTVWEQLRALERTLGCTLLRREGRAIELTSEGELLLEIVQPHVEAIDSLERLFGAGRRQLPPQLTVASSQYLLRYHLAHVIQEFMAAYPHIHLNVQHPTAGQLTTAVEQHRADVAVCAYEPDEPRSEVLAYEPLLDLPLRLLVAKRHPLAKKKQVALHDLLEYPVILPAADSLARRLIDRLLHRHELSGRLRVIMESPIFDTIQQYVALGIGVGLMHMRVDAESLSNVHVRAFQETSEPLSIAMVVRKHARLPPPVVDFQQFVRKTLGKLRE
jgi:DNA-binding transcriptional LysR family regulator